MTSPILLRGFVSPWSEHAHLLKHVVRITEIADGPDKERWEEIIPEPPLVANLERRRASALALLSRVSGCLAGSEGLTSGRPCARCQDPRAMHVVSYEMNTLFRAYLATAQAAMDSAFSNPDRHGPRLVAYRTARGDQVETVDARHVRVVAAFDGPSTARVVTCYRDRNRSLQSHWLELARLRAAYRRAGTLKTLG